MKLKPPVLRHQVVTVKCRVLHHLSNHRLEWACGLAIFFFLLGWFLHSEMFKHWAEFTLAPAAEAFLSRQVE